MKINTSYDAAPIYCIDYLKRNQERVQKRVRKLNSVLHKPAKKVSWENATAKK